MAVPVLADHERLLKAVVAVVNEAKKGTKIAVVVSAMGKTTDLLMTTAKNTSNGKLEKKDLDDILSMGERTSVRIFAAALRSNGANACYFDPIDLNWPIITDEAFQNANPLLQDCENNIKECILPIVEKGTIPVIAGFIGKTKGGKITTLGRGGSDTTAFILAEALNADQVVLVTDADGIMSGDPKIVTTPKRLAEIDVNTLVGLADSGAKFIHSKALKFKPKNIDVKVISNANGDLSSEGTLIKGALATELDAEIAHPTPVAEITVIGNGLSANRKIITEMVEKVKENSTLLGMSMNTNSIILYVPQEKNIDNPIQPNPRNHNPQQKNHSHGSQKRPCLHPNQRRRLGGNPRHHRKNQRRPQPQRHKHQRHPNHHLQHPAFCRLERKRKSSQTNQKLIQNALGEKTS